MRSGRQFRQPNKFSLVGGILKHSRTIPSPLSPPPQDEQQEAQHPDLPQGGSQEVTETVPKVVPQEHTGGKRAKVEPQDSKRGGTWDNRTRRYDEGEEWAEEYRLGVIR